MGVTEPTIMEEKKNKNQQEEKKTKTLVWDCDSSLYDSFELKSFKRQLDSAIASRSFSMPHNSHNPYHPPSSSSSSSSSTDTTSRKRTSRVSRSLQKLVRAIFRSKPTVNSALQLPVVESEERFYVVYQHAPAEKGGVTTGIVPEFDAMIGRTASARFTGNRIGISCS